MSEQIIPQPTNEMLFFPQQDSEQAIKIEQAIRHYLGAATDERWASITKSVLNNKEKMVGLISFVGLTVFGKLGTAAGLDQSLYEYLRNTFEPFQHSSSAEATWWIVGSSVVASEILSSQIQREDIQKLLRVSMPIGAAVLVALYAHMFEVQGYANVPDVRDLAYNVFLIAPTYVGFRWLLDGQRKKEMFAQFKNEIPDNDSLVTPNEIIIEQFNMTSDNTPSILSSQIAPAVDQL